MPATMSMETNTVDRSGEYDVDPNYDKLVDKLHQRTVERKILWELGDVVDEYVASLKGKVTFTLKRIKENYRYVLTMRNETGEVVFRISHANLASASSEALLRLYKLAERIARQIDDEVDKAIELLDNLGGDD